MQTQIDILYMPCSPWKNIHFIKIKPLKFKQTKTIIDVNFLATEIQFDKTITVIE